MLFRRNRNEGEWFIHFSDDHRKDVRYRRDSRYTYIIYGYPLNLSDASYLEVDQIDPTDLLQPVLYFDRTEGHGTLIALDHEKQELIILTDPYRLYVLYHYADEEQLLISDSLSEIRKQVSLQINDLAVTELAVMNTTIGNKTICRNVETLEEGCYHRFSAPGKEVLSECLRPFPEPGGAGLSPDDYVRSFYQWVDKGIQNSNGVSLALTAGLDSRATLAAALTKTPLVHTYTHGFRDSMDVTVAAKLAHRVGVDHRFYSLDDHGLINRIPEMYAEVNKVYEGSLNALSHAHAVNSYSTQQEVADVFLSSFGGELLRSYYLPPGTGPGTSLDQMANGIREISSVKTDLSIFSDPNSVEDRLNHSIYEELRKAPDHRDPHYLADFYYHQRNFNSVTTRFAGRYFRVFSPYFTRYTYEAALSAGTSAKVSGELQKQLVIPAGRKLTGVLLNNKVPIVQNDRMKWLVRQKRLSYLSQVAINKLTNRWTFRLYFTDYDKWIRQEHASWFLETFRNIPDHSGLNATELEHFTRRYLKGEVPFQFYKLLTNLHATLDYLQVPVRE